VSWPGDVGPGAVVEPLVMLAEQIVTVVAAVWRVDDAVNVIARWHDIVERDARMVIEHDEHDRALDPVVEGAIIGDRADPGEVGLIQMLIHFGHLHPRVALARPADIDGGQSPQAPALHTGQVSVADTRISNHSVVPERTGLHPAVQEVLQLRGEVIGIDRWPQNSLGRLPLIKRADEIQANPLLARQQMTDLAIERGVGSMLVR
jgi:hypothetical protein